MEDDYLIGNVWRFVFYVNGEQENAVSGYFGDESIKQILEENNMQDAKQEEN